MKNKLQTATVYRVYKCLDCEGQVGIEQTLIEDFIKLCPFCDKESMVISSGTLGISIVMDSKKPKTLGAQSDHNIRQDEKEGKFRSDKPKPFYRPKQKVNFDVLKNPSKYVGTGQI